MIRVIVAVIGLLILWMWLATKLKQGAKIGISLTAFALVIGLLSYDSYRSTPRVGIVDPSQVEVCGLQVKHHYRNDYKVDLCLENNSVSTLIRRLEFDVIATRNVNGERQTLVSNQNTAVMIESQKPLQFDQIVTFKDIESTDLDQVIWTIDIKSVKALSL